MAAKKKKSGFGQLSLPFQLNDERIPKIIGMLSLLLAIYLLIAFTSYLFTWQKDQDMVLQFNWSLLFEGDVKLSNWLGRLGAIVSNMFFYWGFGIASYIFVFLFSAFAMNRIKKYPLSNFVPVLWNSFLLLISLSILLAFFFSTSSFPIGGAFGESISQWLINFVGVAGMIALIFFVGLAAFVWSVNPELASMTPTSAWKEIQGSLSDLINGRKRPTKPTNSVPATSRPHTALRPGSIDMEVDEGTGEVPEAPQNPDLIPTEKAGAAKEPATEIDEDGQLSIDLNKAKREKPVSLRSGEGELEIAESVPDTPIPDDEDVPHDVLADKTDITRLAQNHDSSEPYDPTLELSSYEHPVLALLEDHSDQTYEIDRAELERNKDQIIETLLNYKIEIIKIKATIGPTVTLYEIIPAPGVRISRIKNLEDDIALSLSALGIRIIAPIPGKGTIGIEVPNKNKQTVSLKEVLSSEKFKRAKMDLPIALGKTINNEVFVADLAKMPHLLVAGATGQGKSVGVNVILMSLIYKKHPSQIKFVLIDPKKVELFPYARLENHFLAYLPGLDEPIVTDTTKVVHTLNSLLIEMDNRYTLLKKAKARNIREYNEKFVSRRLNPNNGHQFMPFIVLVIDEFADLIMTAGKEIELPIGRLAQLSRAVGIHLIIATQRPSVNIITGVIKANFPARMAFRVTAKVDSRTIIDTGGADRLIGRGDLLLAFGSDLIRLQCAFVDTPEVDKVIEYISNQKGYPTPWFLPEFHGDDDGGDSKGINTKDLDDMFVDAARLVVQNQHGSTSMIQRRLKLGYNRAGRIMDQLEGLGIVGPSEGSKARTVLVNDEVELERYLEGIKARK
ncbi:MAG: S-DNA-T family DNA segregation ATPase FtsK/SpoIIIE [Polaribacter sp.]|jgi:S-DNA-T family DNA segregation ATPase FtsK/SpoIIIE